MCIYICIYISLSLFCTYIYIRIHTIPTYIHTYIHENFWDFLCRDFRTNFHSTQEKKTGAEVLSRLGCLKLQRGQRVLLGALGVGLWAWGSGDQPARRIMRLSRRIPRQPQLGIHDSNCNLPANTMSNNMGKSCQILLITYNTNIIYPPEPRSKY